MLAAVSLSYAALLPSVARLARCAAALPPGGPPTPSGAAGRTEQQSFARQRSKCDGVACLEVGWPAAICAADVCSSFVDLPAYRGSDNATLVPCAITAFHARPTCQDRASGLLFVLVQLRYRFLLLTHMDARVLPARLRLTVKAASSAAGPGSAARAGCTAAVDPTGCAAATPAAPSPASMASRFLLCRGPTHSVRRRHRSPFRRPPRSRRSRRHQ